MPLTPQPIPLVRLVLVREGPRDAFPPLRDASTAAAAARVILGDRDRETFLAIHLDARLCPLSAEVVAVGTLTATLVHPREVFKGALLSNAASILLAHSHPSGDPTPSAEDLRLTETLLAAGALLGVEVQDHLIVGETTLSLRETTALWNRREAP